MLRVAAFTGGRHVSCARFRVHEYQRPLAALGIALEVFPARFGSFPPRRRALRPLWGGATLLQRIPDLLRSRAYAVTLLQRELVSTLATLEGWTGRPRVFDVDDAVWLHARRDAIRRIARRCDAVICGNAFLADYFRAFHPDVRILPTAVDTDRFAPAGRPDGPPVIGWTGTSSNFRYLEDIESSLGDVLRARPTARLRIVADAPPPFRRLPADRVDFVPWSPAVEASAVQGMTVGIMPLRDTSWERGKCSHKMLLYMAAGVPVVVSPVGMNRDVLGLGPVGLAATTPGEWREALVGLLDDPAAASRMGAAGREVVLRRFSLAVLAPILAAILQEVAGAPAPSPVVPAAPAPNEMG
jgi:glycosyltransferase involved in cell wall biosynthesis